jgi:hypothetical protein
MTNSTESRFITYPTILEKSPVHHTVLLVDPYELETKVLTIFLQSCPLNFDIYFYTGETYDLEWLNAASKSADMILINTVSEVSSTDAVRYGPNLELPSCVNYFRQFAAQNS